MNGWKLEYAALPGSELVRKGLADRAAGVESVEALLLLVGAPRLRALGIDPGPNLTGQPAEHRLFRMLEATRRGDAHSAYNALIRRLTSFERALEHALSARGQPFIRSKNSANEDE